MKKGEKALDEYLLALSKIEKRELFRKLHVKSLAEARQRLADVVYTFLLGGYA